MAKFGYKAKEGPGKLVNGVIDAESMDNAVAKIVKMGLIPVDIAPEEGQTAQKKTRRAVTKPGFRIIKLISLSDVVLFSRQMSDLVDAAVPILRSLQIIEKQTRNVHLKEKVSAMHKFVQDGGSFSGALAQHPNIFSSLYVNMVKTGEVSGQLEVILNRLADYLENEYETQKRIKFSLAYPAFILILGIVTIFVLFTFIVPRLQIMFDDLNQQLPLPTLILTGISSVFARFWWLILAATAAGVYYFRYWINTESGRLSFDAFKLKIPFFGNFIRTVEIGRFARTFGTLVESGVVITTALNSVWATVNNVILRDEIRQVSEEVTQGSSLKAALEKCSFFPEMAVNMISVGEETGRLDRGLYKIADTYERQADQMVKTILSLLGPAILCIIVMLIGYVVISLLLPILQMNTLIQ